MRGIEDKWKSKVAFLRKGVQDAGTANMMDALQFIGVPSVVVVDPKGGELARFQGWMSADDLNALLKQVTTKT